MISEKVYHPVFGLLTDEEDIMVYELQQARDEYYNQMERAYEEEYHEQCEKELQLVNKCLPGINYLEETMSFWNENDLAEIANVSLKDAKYVIHVLNI